MYVICSVKRIGLVEGWVSFTCANIVLEKESLGTNGIGVKKVVSEIGTEKIVSFRQKVLILVIWRSYKMFHLKIMIKKL